MTSIYIREKTKLPQRSPNELYTTEHTIIRAAVNSYAPLYAGSILDIGAADGRWGTLAAEKTEAFTLVGVDIADFPPPVGFSHWYPNQDYLTWNPEGKNFDLIVSNPPYRHAEEIIRKAWAELRPGGTMIMLLRLAFQTGTKRYWGLWNEVYPHTVAACSRRPSFYGGKTNGTDYGIYVWEKLPGGLPLGQPRKWQMELLIHSRSTNRTV